MAKLILLLAACSPDAVLIKLGSMRGRNRFSCTVGWDRRRDTFRMGQCLRYRIQIPDISPDGQYFSYYIDTNNPLRKYREYSGISRTPWLKALTFWGENPVSSLFLPDSPTGHPRIHTFGYSPKPDRNQIGVEMIPDCPPEWASIKSESIQVIQWLRDGWRMAVPWSKSTREEAWEVLGWFRTRGVPRLILEKTFLNGWKLRMTQWRHANYHSSQGKPFETFALISPHNEVRHLPGWDSADFDPIQERVVWTADNRLHAAPLKRDGLGEDIMLWDGRELQFTAIEAPY